MSERQQIEGLQIAPELADFVETRALPGTGVASETFWTGLSRMIHELGPENRSFLEKREDLQKQIDDWHIAHRDQPHDHTAYRAFLEQIGYLLPEGDAFEIETANVDPEIASVPGPQLVVPITNARYALNAANARWGSFMTGSTAPMRWARPRQRADMTKGVVRGLWRGRVCSWMRRFRLMAAAMRTRDATTFMTARC